MISPVAMLTETWGISSGPIRHLYFNDATLQHDFWFEPHLYSPAVDMESGSYGHAISRLAKEDVAHAKCRQVGNHGASW